MNRSMCLNCLNYLLACGVKHLRLGAGLFSSLLNPISSESFRYRTEVQDYWFSYKNRPSQAAWGEASLMRLSKKHFQFLKNHRYRWAWSPTRSLSSSLSKSWAATSEPATIPGRRNLGTGIDTFSGTRFSGSTRELASKPTSFSPPTTTPWALKWPFWTLPSTAPTTSSSGPSERWSSSRKSSRSSSGTSRPTGASKNF